MVIRGAEPVVVDTGMAENREQFLADVFSLVEPEDIRWVFISHDDVDHTGNVNALMELAPNATLVINWFMQERMGASLEVSPLRQRWVGDGEILDVGDRKLLAIRPPVFDSPTTRGLFDPTTGVYWASDCFATPMLTAARNVAEIDAEFWAEGMTMFNRYVSPWLELIDDAKFQHDRRPRRQARRLGDGRLPHAGDQPLARRRRARDHPPLGHGAERPRRARPGSARPDPAGAARRPVKRPTLPYPPADPAPATSPRQNR